jgi:cell division protein DivIC
MISAYLKTVFNFISRYKYIISLAGFGLWIGFLDGNNIYDQVTLYNEISMLNDQKEQYLKVIEEDRIRLQELNKNQHNIERVAREKYYMHKSNETVFVITEKNENKD